jgi:hypothetical protein
LSDAWRGQVDRVLASHLAKTGRHATVREMRRWAAIYRTVADGLDRIAGERECADGQRSKSKARGKAKR